MTPMTMLSGEETEPTLNSTEPLRAAPPRLLGPEALVDSTGRDKATHQN
jgi:hypothetical protein